jgi:hypothetical protein
VKAINRWILLAVAGVVIVVGGVMVARDEYLGWIPLACGLVAVVVLLWRPPAHKPTVESNQIGLVPEDRIREMIRGTSMHLREMKYRYSVRADPGERSCFNAEVNTIKLGFVPVIITDNHTDKQGVGYVAFPYDGRRWRGPGLPCAGSPQEAVAHATRCVEPLGGEDTTS